MLSQWGRDADSTRRVRGSLGVLEIFLVADGSGNGRNPDLSVVARYCLIFRAFHGFTLLFALFVNDRSDFIHYWQPHRHSAPS
jgi:hypothetical protein